MTKTCIVLFLYDLLKKDGKFQLKDIENKFNCSNRTAARYIAEIKKYFILFNIRYEIKYIPKEKTYVLLNLDNE